MNPKPSSILALFARGRQIGYVLIEHGEIYQYGVKTLRVKLSFPDFGRQVGKTVLALFERIEPECVVVIERRTDNPHGQLTKAFTHIVEAFISGVYPLMEISLDEVKMALCRNKRVTHQRVIEQVVARYPTFQSMVFGASGEKARYWKKALMALALALAAHEQLKKENRREPADF